MTRSKPARDRQRKVFQQRRRPGRWSQAFSGLLLLALGAGLLVGLMQLPERLDTMLLVSTAIANLIGGLGRFLQGLLQLLAVLVLVLVVIGALLLLGAGLVRLLRSVLPGPAGSAPLPRQRR